MSRKIKRDIKHVDAWVIFIVSIPVLILAFIYVPAHMEWSGNPRLFHTPANNGLSFLEVEREFSKEIYKASQEVVDRLEQYKGLEKKYKSLGTAKGEEEAIKVQWARHNYLFQCYTEALKQGELSKALFFGAMAQKTFEIKNYGSATERAFMYLRMDMAKIERLLFVG